MKVLLAIAHFYRAKENASHSSEAPDAREERARAVRSVIEAWRGHLGPASILNVERKVFEPVAGAEDALDIVVLVSGEDHLLDAEFCARHRVKLVHVAVQNPRLLPFGAHRLFADQRHVYDMLVYSEDDLRPADGTLLGKIAGFAETFGWRRLLMPNRYEWNLQGPALKTYIDGDLPNDAIGKYVQALPDEPALSQRIPGRELAFARARNPHAGFFALTSEQMRHWVQQPHFNDIDCSFYTPLESAATLAMLKTFPIYKPCGGSSGWLELEHLDSRYSRMTFRRIGLPQPDSGAA
jgi:hypothetical protein